MKTLIVDWRDRRTIQIPSLNNLRPTLGLCSKIQYMHVHFGKQNWILNTLNSKLDMYFIFSLILIGWPTWIECAHFFFILLSFFQIHFEFYCLFQTICILYKIYSFGCVLLHTLCHFGLNFKLDINFIV